MDIKCQQIQFRVDRPLLKRLNTYAKRKGINKSLLLRTLIANYLKENE